jgi:hypothetical protein
LRPFRSGPAPDTQRHDQVVAALGERRTWTGRQLSATLADRGIAPGPRQVRRYLRRMRA